MSITVDQVVKQFVITRDEIAKRDKAHKADVALLKEDLEKMQDWLRVFLEDSGQKGAKTDFGTVHFTKKESVKVADWDKFKEYVVEHGAWELLKKDVAKKGVLEIMGDDRDGTLMPPGLDYKTFREVGVRRS